MPMNNHPTKAPRNRRGISFSCLALSALCFSACDTEDQNGQRATSEPAPVDIQSYLDQNEEFSKDVSDSEFRQARIRIRRVRRGRRVRLPFWIYQALTPELNCVEELDNGLLRAHWGYTNHRNYTSSIRIGWWNGLSPYDPSRPQPEVFLPGRHEKVFTTDFDASRSQRWWLMWNSAVADSNSPRCETPDLCESVSCDDGNPCTLDACDSATGECSFPPAEDGVTCEADGEAGSCVQGSCEVLCQNDADCDDGNSCTENSCDANGACVNEAQNEGLQCSTDAGEVGLCGGAGSCERLALYTAGHGDMGFEVEFDEATGEFEPHVHLEGGTVDGSSLDDEEFAPEAIAIVTNAELTRPVGDEGALQQLCVAQGESVKWLPQSGADASRLGVPFFGIAAEEIDAGQFVNDEIFLELVSVESPNGTGHYSLWQAGVTPEFGMASCDGIDGGDKITIPLGHDHYNMGFAGDGPGLWRISYKVSGIPTGQTEPIEALFTMNYLIQ